MIKNGFRKRPYQSWNDGFESKDFNVGSVFVGPFIYFFSVWFYQGTCTTAAYQCICDPFTRRGTTFTSWDKLLDPKVLGPPLSYGRSLTGIGNHRSTLGNILTFLPWIRRSCSVSATQALVPTCSRTRVTGVPGPFTSRVTRLKSGGDRRRVGTCYSRAIGKVYHSNSYYKIKGLLLRCRIYFYNFRWHSM